MKKIFFNPRFLLPLAILLGFFVVTTRVADMWEIVASGKLWVRQAQAENTPAPAKEAASEPAKETAAAKEAAPAPKEAPPAETKSGPSLPPEATEISPAEMDVLKQLSERRVQLEKRSKDIDTREALLKVTEQRVDQKVKALEALRQQLQSLVNQAGGAQTAQIENLVKIFESMKADEAAKIFDTLDMPVLLGVIKLMKPKSTASIMAKMPPEKAKEITVALTKQDQLPQAKTEK